jgi:hypothetical protein
VWGTVGANETPYISYQQSNPVAVNSHVYDNVFSGINAKTFTKIGSYYV